jgi:hypothetical protein
MFPPDAKVGSIFDRQGAAAEVKSIFEEGAKPCTALKQFAPEFLESKAILDQEYPLRSHSELIVQIVRRGVRNVVTVGLFGGFLFP